MEEQLPKTKEPAIIVLEALLAGLEVTDKVTGRVFRMTEDFDIAEQVLTYQLLPNNEADRDGKMAWISFNATVGWLVAFARHMSFEELFIISANTILNTKG